MPTSVAVAQLQYLLQNREVRATQSDNIGQDQSSTPGDWTGDVFAQQPGGSRISSAIQTSSLATSGINATFSIFSNLGGTAFTRLFTTFRLSDQSLISFNCEYLNFVGLDITEFKFSLVGNGYNYAFTGDPRGENIAFSQSNVLLGPGDYTLDLEISTIAFNSIRGNFALTAAPVPAPGAAGVALVGAAALAGRRRRET